MTFNTLGYTTVQQSLGSLFLRGFVVCVAAISKFPWALEKESCAEGSSNPLTALISMDKYSHRKTSDAIFPFLVAEKYAQKE